MSKTIQIVKNKLVENSDLLKNWKEDQVIINTTCFTHNEATALFRKVKETSPVPDNFDRTLWDCARFIGGLLKKEGVKCQVLRGNGSTSPTGSDKATNYFTVERTEKYRKESSNKLYLNFDMTVENVKEIVAILEKYYIPFVWEGRLGSCITFNLNREGYPE